MDNEHISMSSQVDYTRLSPSLKEKLKAIEQNKPANQQLKVLRELSEVFETVAVSVGALQEGSEQSASKLNDSISDIQDLLKSLNQKEQPEQKDFSKPVVDSMKSLEKALTTAVRAIDINPEFKPNIQVQAPRVDVSSPDVEVDLSGVERILKTDVPKAFKQAIAAIPQAVIPKTDLSPLEKKLDVVVEWLQSIDTTSRIKPQFPTTLRVTNVDGTSISVPTTGSSCTPVRVPITSSVSPLASLNANRKEIIIFNDSAANLYVKFGTNASATDFTYKIPASGTLQEDRYLGVLSGLLDSGAGNAQVSEVV
jgi:hypothetical protein